ncbi:MULTISPECIES: maleylpyruvate isomerase family mycothiol-dependent enzyme [unclassified Mycobacterium]|uniref:maleylpyruvate isomerase family mycothiol-dependent enzyme n=1 Tax=unclassified Mycobacterium TaxID=2642494 RepID=UPI0029C9384B|nr:MULTISPECIES: maleylpyruvate isomerase family mycothiol-dependent enzyme [unclassified Mycobacterium]
MAVDTARRLTAAARERRQVLAVCANLDDRQWDAPSRADGWRVRDVIAHLGATTGLMLGVGAHQMWGRGAEELNDVLVARRRSWTPPRVLAEFERYSGRAMTALKIVARAPLGSLRLPVAELGHYPLRLTPSLLLFDWHVHLRHDIAPAIGLPAPPTDVDRMSGVLEWMLAGMEQMNRTTMTWMDRPLNLQLTGLAGGRWHIAPGTGGRLHVTQRASSSARAEIVGRTDEFPSWATTRTPWRASDVSLRGDTDYAERFLDALNII